MAARVGWHNAECGTPLLGSLRRRLAWILESSRTITLPARLLDRGAGIRRADYADCDDYGRWIGERRGGDCPGSARGAPAKPPLPRRCRAGSSQTRTSPCHAGADRARDSVPEFQHLFDVRTIPRGKSDPTGPYIGTYQGWKVVDAGRDRRVREPHPPPGHVLRRQATRSTRRTSCSPPGASRDRRPVRREDQEHGYGEQAQRPAHGHVRQLPRQSTTDSRIGGAKWGRGAPRRLVEEIHCTRSACLRGCV
jgi:hypothetical protein